MPQNTTIEIPTSIPMAAIKALADEHNCDIYLKDTGGLKLTEKPANDSHHVTASPQDGTDYIPRFLREQAS